MAKISDIWVRLGLKKEGFDKGIKDAEKSTQGFGSKLQNIKAGVVAAWAAIGAAIVKVATDTISATNAMGDAWAQNMSKIKTSYRSVLAQVSTNNKRQKGWWLQLFNPNSQAGYDIGANAKAAGDAAKKMTAAFDAEFELVNSVKLQKAGIQQELNQLYVAMRDTTLSAGARQSAMERYKALLEPLAKAEISVYQNMLDSAVEAWQAGNMDILSRQYSTAELTDFFSMYGTDAEGARSKYGELADVYELRQNDEFNALMVDTMMKLKYAQNEMSNTEREMSRVALSIKKGFEEIAVELEPISDEWEDIIIDVDVPELNTPVLDAALQKVKETAEEYQAEIERVVALNEMLEQSIVAATASGMQAFTDMLMGLDGADASGVLAALMQPFADTAGQLGTMLITQGLAIDAFKKSLSSLQGGVAIAAGTALLAISAAMKSGIKALGKGGAGSGSSASYGGSGASTPEMQNYESTLTVEVTGKLSGSDIVISGRKQQDKWNR